MQQIFSVANFGLCFSPTLHEKRGDELSGSGVYVPLFSQSSVVPLFHPKISPLGEEKTIRKWN